MVGLKNTKIGLGGALADYVIGNRSLDCVPMHQQVLMVMSLVEFVSAAVEKFGAGQRAHGGSITDRDLGKEMSQELIDSFWYHQAHFVWKPIDSIRMRQQAKVRKAKKLSR